MNILRMVNPVMPYVWGSKSFIQELTGNNKDKGTPQAELWMGGHPGSSSHIQNGDLLVNLHYIIAEDPLDFIGNKVARAYNDQLPFLLKVLAADEPLSIQVHPNKKQAREGFALENKLGIALDAPNRNYKDSFHKPELLVALTDFHALCGFRDLEELRHLLKKYLPKISFPAFSSFYEQPSGQTLEELYSFIMKADLATRQEIIDHYLKHVHSALPANPQEQLINEWSAILAQSYPSDIGILSPLLLNIVVLKPMEGLYLEAGVLHSYLKGAGMEIMANSDNVLRGGLTPKHVETDELLKVLDYTPRIIHPVKAEKVSTTEQLYVIPVDEFALSVIRHSHGQTSEFKASGSPEILFCYEGNFEVVNCSQILSMERGQSLFVPYEVEGFLIKGKGTIFRARCNI